MRVSGAAARKVKSKKLGTSKNSEDSKGLTGFAVRLKLGADCSGEAQGAFKFFICVGDSRQGPFDCDFSEKPVAEFPLEVDWRKVLEGRSESLRLRIELIDCDM